MPASVQIVDGAASAKLGRNLDLALDRQTEILSKPITAETDCEFRFNPATDSDLKPAGIPI
jgi:hypothetical protein